MRTIVHAFTDGDPIVVDDSETAIMPWRDLYYTQGGLYTAERALLTVWNLSSSETVDLNLYSSQRGTDPGSGSAIDACPPNAERSFEIDTVLRRWFKLTAQSRGAAAQLRYELVVV